MWLDVLLDILKYLLIFIAGGVVGFFVARKLMTKYLKKNPPINEEMIRTLMSGMGRTPTQKQVTLFQESNWLMENYNKNYLSTL